MLFCVVFGCCSKEFIFLAGDLVGLYIPMLACRSALSPITPPQEPKEGMLPRASVMAEQRPDVLEYRACTQSGVQAVKLVILQFVGLSCWEDRICFWLPVGERSSRGRFPVMC